MTFRTVNPGAAHPGTALDFSLAPRGTSGARVGVRGNYSEKTGGDFPVPSSIGKLHPRLIRNDADGVRPSSGAAVADCSMVVDFTAVDFRKKGSARTSTPNGVSHSPRAIGRFQPFHLAAAGDGRTPHLHRYRLAFIQRPFARVDEVFAEIYDRFEFVGRHFAAIYAIFGAKDARFEFIWRLSAFIRDRFALIRDVFTLVCDVFADVYSHLKFVRRVFAERYANFAAIYVISLFLREHFAERNDRRIDR
jgi:hypothetical protein